MSELGKILRRIGDFDNKENRDRYLESKGHDLKELDQNAVDIFNRISAKSKLKEARIRKELFTKARKLLEEKDVPDVKKLISSSISSQFAYQFSKLENISTNDILSMLKDEELLKIIEKLED